MPRPPSLEIALTSPTPAALWMLRDAQAPDALKAILAGRLFQVLLMGHLNSVPAAGPQSS